MKKILIIIGVVLTLSSCGNDNNRYEYEMKDNGDVLVFDTSTAKLHILITKTKKMIELDMINGKIVEKKSIIPVKLNDNKE